MAVGRGPEEEGPSRHVLGTLGENGNRLLPKLVIELGWKWLLLLSMLVRLLSLGVVLILVFLILSMLNIRRCFCCCCCCIDCGAVIIVAVSCLTTFLFPRC